MIYAGLTPSEDFSRNKSSDNSWKIRKQLGVSCPTPENTAAVTFTEVAFTQCEAEDRTITLDPGPEIIISPPPPPPLVTPDLITGQTCEDGCVEEIVCSEIPNVDSPLVVNQLL